MRWFCTAFIGWLLLFNQVSVLQSRQVEQDYGDEDYDDYMDFNESSNNSTLHFTRELVNITRDAGRTVRMVCEVKNLLQNSTNQNVTFRWLKFSVPITTDKRVTILRKDYKHGEQIHRCVLKIKDLEVTDKAFYECVASNGVDKIKSAGVLTVNPEKWNGFSSDVSSYKSVFDDNEGLGSSMSDITTFIPNVQDVQLSTISIRPDIDTHNDKQRSVTLSYNSSEKFCQRYSGTRCKQYLEDRYVFVQPPYSQQIIEAKVENAFLVISQSQDISPSCNKFAQPSLCFSAFPLCVEPQQTNIYQENYINKNNIFGKSPKNQFSNIRNKLLLQRICREDCLLLETELCSKEYAIAKRHPVIGQILELEECQHLPDNTDSILNNCLKLGVDRSQDIDKDDTCYWDDGATYRGVKDTSVSGAKCLRWSQQFSMPLLENPEIMTHSFCRNPEGKDSEPYCFVESNKKEICGVPKCIYVFSIYIGVSLLVLLFCTVVAYLCYRKKYRGTRNLQNLSISPASKNIYGHPGPNSPIELNSLLPANIPPQRNHHNNKNGFENVPKYTHKELVFVQELGEGAFGKVYKGELKTKEGKVFVAVKSLKENACAKTQADFQREIELISELKHPNIICLLGVVTKQEPMCMLFEFMSEGDLHEFLISNSPNDGKSLTQMQFLHIALQIAQGMEYLAENHYVHRDLAARNCLVSKELVVKISDFGLSRDMYSCDYYRVQSKSLLPVRWMPPESILYGKFTTESDVWSYGVVLWEIYSYGLQPYYGYNNQEVINMIRARKLLPCPDVCPSYCYALMIECWAELAVRRPSFGEISHRFRVWKQNGCTDGAYFKNPEVVTNLQNCTPYADGVVRHGQGSKSSHTSESQAAVMSSTWDRNSRKMSSTKLNDSQSSLTSRSSSLGNKTQSTSLSNEHNLRGKRGEKKAPKNIVVSSDGDNFETMLSQ